MMDYNSQSIEELEKLRSSSLPGSTAYERIGNVLEGKYRERAESLSRERERDAEARAEKLAVAQVQIPSLSRLKDPLSEVTRRERRLLLIVSVVVLALTWGGLIPSKVEAFGITLAEGEQAVILALAGLTNLYLFFAFIIYGATDLQVWKGELTLFSAKFKQAVETKKIHGLESIEETLPIIWTRATFDLMVPGTFGAFAFASCFTFLIPSTSETKRLTLLVLSMILLLLLWLSIWKHAFRSNSEGVESPDASSPDPPSPTD